MCQQCGNTMAHVERYLVLQLVARTREARLPGDYELQCTRCLTSGRHSLCEVVLEHASSKCAARTPTGERMLTLGKQVLEHSTAHGVDVIEAIAAVLSDSSDGENRKLLEMMRKTVADSERPSP
jgi:hypothetical protein